MVNEPLERLRQGLGREQPQSRLGRAGAAESNLNPQPRLETGGLAQDAGRLLGFLGSGEQFLGAFGVDIDPLPDPLEFGVDVIASPIGLASTLLFPVTGGASLGLSGAAATAARAGTRVGAELAVAGVATQAGRAAAEFVPEDSPGLVRFGVPILSGLVAGGLSSSAINRAVSNSVRPAAASLQRQTADAYGFNYAVPPPGLDEVTDTITGVDTGLLHAARKVPGAPYLLDPAYRKVDPSRYVETDIGRNLLGFIRQTERAQELAASTTYGAMAPHLRRGKGIPFDIDDAGKIATRQGRIAWNKAFSDPQAPKTYGFDDAQAAFWDDYMKVVDDGENLLRQHGSKRNFRTVEGELYVPRIVKNRYGGVEVENPTKTNPHLARVFDDANEAVAKGVRYDDPMETLFLYMNNAYSEVAHLQFDEAMELVPSFTAKEFLKETNARVVLDYDDAKQAIRKQLSLVRRTRRKIANRVAKKSEAKAAGRPRRPKTLAKQEQELRTELQTQQEELLRLREKKEVARLRYTSAMDRALKGTQDAPGSLLDMADADNVPVTVWRNRFYERTDDIAKVQEFFGRGNKNNVVLDSANSVGGWLRTIQASADFAMPFIQGFPLLVTNPVRWSRMTANHFRAFLDPGTQSRYINQNMDDVLEMVRHGVPVGDVEFFDAIRAGQTNIAARIARRPLSPFQRSYDTGLLVTRTELWKSLRNNWDGSLEDLATYINKMTGSLSSRGLGVGPGQRALESVALFSPRLARSTIAYVSQIAKPNTPGGQQAILTLQRMMGAAAMTMIFANVAEGIRQGETEAEIEARIKSALDPTEGKKFLSVQVGDDWLGIGTQFRSVAQLVARVLTDPPSLAEIDQLDNPLVSFVATKTAPLPRIGLTLGEFATGNDYLPFKAVDQPWDVATTIGTGILPFTAQGLIEGEGWSAAGAGALGARTSAATPSELLNAAAQNELGVEWRELDPTQKQELLDAHPELANTRSEFGPREDRIRRERIDQINETARDNLTEQAAALFTGVPAPISRRQFADNVDELIRDRAIRLQEQTQAIDFPDASTPHGQALDAWYDLFDEARRGGVIDWDLYEQLEATLFRRIDAGEFGPPARAHREIDKRKRFEVPEEVEFYFDNKDTIREAGYYDIADEEVARVAGLIEKQTGLVVESKGDLEGYLDLAITQGDRRTAAVLSRYLKVIDRRSGTRRESLRRRNPELDAALYQNGKVSRRVTR